MNFYGSARYLNERVKKSAGGEAPPALTPLVFRLSAPSARR